MKYVLYDSSFLSNFIKNNVFINCDNSLEKLFPLLK